MYGKLFERMYTGSMMGSGAMMFAVWPYIISHMKPNRERTVFTVELNTALMAVLIGEKEEEIADIIKQCCQPDLKSRTPDKEGRKLVKMSEYLYEVVNGNVYDQIRRAEDLKESNRRRQNKFYHKKSTENGADELPIPEKPAETQKKFTRPTLDQITATGMPKPDAVDFFNYYQSCGWTVGKNKPMKDWESAAAGWMNRKKKFNGESEPASQLSDAELVRQAQL